MLANLQRKVRDEPLLAVTNLERICHDSASVELADGDNAVGRDNCIAIEVGSVLDARKLGGFTEESNSYRKVKSAMVKGEKMGSSGWDLPSPMAPIALQWPNASRTQ